MRTKTSWALLALLVPALAAAQAKQVDPGPRKTRVAVLDLRAIGVEASKAELLSEIALSEAASLPYLEVIGRSDIQSMLGFEKQKKMLGCEEDSACIAEIGGALGVKYVLVGSIGKLGALYRVDLKVLDTAKAGSVRRQGVNVEGAEEKMVAAVQNAVRALFAPEAAAAGAPVAAAATPPPAVEQPVVQQPAGPGYRRAVIGLRLGYARPGGKLAVFDGSELQQTDWVSGHGFFLLEGAYKVTPRLSLGGTISYGAASTGEVLKFNCENARDDLGNIVPLTCEPAVVRLTLDANFDFAGPEAKVVPWIGLGIGFESLIVTVNGGAGSISASGFEPFHGQLGLDLRFGKLRFGPFAMWSVAKYSTLEFKVGNSTTTNEIDGKVHSYGYFGLRGAAEF